MLVRDFMSSHPACCTEQDSVRHAAQLMQQHDVGAIPVIRNAEDRKLTGIVTDRDLCCRILAEDRPSTTRVVEAMHPRPLRLPLQRQRRAVHGGDAAAPGPAPSRGGR